MHEKLAVARPRENVGDAAVRQRPALLLHQRFQRAARVFAVGCGDEAHCAELGHALAFDAVAPPRRRRALAGVEFLPVAGKLHQMRTAGIRHDVEGDERIALGADGLRHLFQLEPVVAQSRIGLQPLQQFPPQRHEAAGRNPLGKIRSEQRRVIVAQLLAEPAQPFGGALLLDGERHDAGGVAATERPHRDHRNRAVAAADLALPCGEPVEGLKHRAVGDGFEAAPFAFDSGHVVVNAQAQVLWQRAGRGRLRRQRGRTGIRRQACAAKRPQWCRQESQFFARRDQVHGKLLDENS